MARTREFDVDAALESAMDVFRTQGYEAASTRHLERAMGIGTGSLYAAFGSKDGLYVAALERSREQMMAATRAALSSAEDVREVVRRLLEGACVDAAEHQWGPGCLLLRAAYERAGRDPRVDRLLRDAMHALEQSFVVMLSAGRLDPGQDPRAIARFLVTTIQGLRGMALVDPDPDALAGSVDVALGCLR